MSALRDEIKMEGTLLGAEVLFAASSEDVVPTIDSVNVIFHQGIIDFIENCVSAPERYIFCRLNHTVTTVS